MRLIIFFFLFSAVFISCSSDDKSVNEDCIEYTDCINRKVCIKENPKRVIGLAPSITEILFEISSHEIIVARTQACDYPVEALEKSIVSTYPLDVEAIVGKQPDVVFSIEGMISPGDLLKIENSGINVIVQRYITIQDIKDGITQIGKVLNENENAEKLVNKISNELKKINVNDEFKPSVLAITWQNPIYVYGFDSPFTEKIELAGGVNAMTEPLGNPFPEINSEYILKIDPDIITGRSFEEMDSSFFNRYPELKRIKAYQNKNIFETDDNLLSRPSPRVVESILELKTILNKVENK